MNQFFKIYFKIGLLFIQLVCLPHSNLVRMKDTQKISSLFIQLICLLPLQKSCSVVENLFRNWFFFHPHGHMVCFPISNYHVEQSLLKNQFDFHPTGLFTHFQLSCRVQQYLLEYWFVFHPTGLFFHFLLLIMQCRVAFIEKIGLFIIQLVCLPISIYRAEYSSSFFIICLFLSNSFV